MLLRPYQVGALDVFARSGPLVMEAGFGDGAFLAHLARTRPKWNLLGADVSRGSVSRARRRMLRTGAQHVRLFLGKAEYLLRNGVPTRGLHRLYVNFPDPWPKRRHHHRRLIRDDFLALASTRLAPGSAIVLTTDDEAYAARAARLARGTELYEVATLPCPPIMLQTKYGSRWHAMRRRIHHLQLTCIAAYPGRFEPLKAARAMHHVLMNGTLPQPVAFTSFRRVFVSGQVVVTGALQRVGERGLVFEARVEEEDLAQDVLIEACAARAAGADIIVRIATFGQPLATRGTREAIEAIEEWLAQHGMHTFSRYC